MIRLIFLHLAISFSSISQIYGNLISEASSKVRIFFYFHVSLVLGVQLVSIYFVKRRWSISAAEYALAAWLGANILLFDLYFSESFLTLGPVLKIAAALTILLFISLLLKAALKTTFGYRSVVILFLLSGSWSIMSAKVVDVENKRKDWRTFIEPRWRDLKFSQTPNVHIVSFDSMIPPVLAKKHLDLPEVAYAKPFYTSQSPLLKNAFVSAVPTKPALNALLALDDLENYPNDNYFSGQGASPVMEIFKNNGYKIATGFSVQSYFGNKGPLIDKYNYDLSRWISDSTLCKFQPNRFRGFAFCAWSRVMQKSGEKWGDQVVKELATPSKNNTPWLTVHYIYEPIGHTPPSFISGDQEDLSEYRDEFVKQSAIAERMIGNLINRVLLQDPNAIIFVFGDHGPFLSRTATHEVEPRFFVQDRYGVFMSLVKSQNRCSTPDLSVYNKKFHTAGRVLASVIRCLATDPKVMDANVHFAGGYNFDEYLYE